MTIWKFELSIDDEIVVQMPEGARILSVQTQGGPIPMLWAVVDPTAPKVKRRLILRGTGHPMSLEDAILPFIGTFQLQGGALVFHLFDGGEVA